MKGIKVWVVKDSNGVLRPLAGIWIDGIEKRTGVNYGKESAEEYQAKNKQGDTVVLCELTEIK